MGFNLFGTFIPYYGFCIVIGIVCAYILGFLLCKKSNLNTDDFLLIAAYLFAFGFLGAKVLYVLISLRSINFSSLFKSIKSFNLFLNSGFVFYGGLIGGLLGLLFIKKIHKIKTNQYIKILAPCISLAHAFGRIGCSLAGCCYGKVTSCRFYFSYSNSIIAPSGVNLFPVQGVESFCLFFLTLILVILYLKNKECRVHLIYLISYSILRFILEFYRGDTERGQFLCLSTSQLVSILIFFNIILYLIYMHIQIRKSKSKKKIS